MRATRRRTSGGRIRTTFFRALSRDSLNAAPLGAAHSSLSRHLALDDMPLVRCTGRSYFERYLWRRAAKDGGVNLCHPRISRFTPVVVGDDDRPVGRLPRPIGSF